MWYSIHLMSIKCTQLEHFLSHPVISSHSHSHSRSLCLYYWTRLPLQMESDKSNYTEWFCRRIQDRPFRLDVEISGRNSKQIDNSGLCTDFSYQNLCVDKKKSFFQVFELIGFTNVKNGTCLFCTSDLKRWFRFYLHFWNAFYNVEVKCISIQFN